MKMPFIKIFTLSLLLIISKSYAFNIACPPPHVILSSGQLVEASKIQQDRWLMTANPIFYQNNIWYLQYYVTLPNVSNSKNAIEFGQNLFNQSRLLDEPSSNRIANRIECQYLPHESTNMIRVLSYLGPFD